jgi:hypothetical protein
VGAIRRFDQQPVVVAAGAIPADGSEDRALCMHEPLTEMPIDTAAGHDIQEEKKETEGRTQKTEE